MANVYKLAAFLFTCILCFHIANGRRRNHRTGLRKSSVRSYTTIEEYVCNKKFRGCWIDYSKRSCVLEEAVGCKNPFPFTTMEECNYYFLGQGNICDTQPCKNGGICLNSSSGGNRTFKCLCHNTGYTGDTCSEACPSPGALTFSTHQDAFSCILI